MVVHIALSAILPRSSDKYVCSRISHLIQIFLKPEGSDVPTIYPSDFDIASSVGSEEYVHQRGLRLRNAPGYALEYDLHADPRRSKRWNLNSTLAGNLCRSD
jgi:hypothetical protein